jgi:HlyD family secretion protein
MATSALEPQTDAKDSKPLAPPAHMAALSRARKKPFPTKIVLGVLTVVIAAGGLWLSRRHADIARATAATAELVTAAQGEVESAVDSSGKVVSNLDVDIKCRASGEVINLPFDISQTVKKGDLLCQLDPTDGRLAVRSAEAVVAQSSAKLAQSKNDLEQAKLALDTSRRKAQATLAAAKVKADNLRAKADRQNELIQQALGSKEEMENAQTDAAVAENDYQSAQIAIDELKQQEVQIQFKEQAVKMAEAQLQSDQITLDTQQQQLAYTTVTAPLNAVVSALNVQKGTIVASGMSGFSGGTTIMTLSDMSRVFIIATVDESDIGGVRVGQKARITLASFPNQSFEGAVVRIAITGVNSSNVVTFEVKVEVLDKRKGLLRPQMTGNVTIVEEQRQDVLTVPSSVVTRDGGRTVVTMADGQRREVKLGLQGAENVEVLWGLSAGEKVRVVTEELPSKWKSVSNGPPGP